MPKARPIRGDLLTQGPPPLRERIDEALDEALLAAIRQRFVKVAETCSGAEDVIRGARALSFWLSLTRDLHSQTKGLLDALLEEGDGQSG